MTQGSLNISPSTLNTLQVQKAEGVTFLRGNHFLKKHKQVQAGKNDWLYVTQIEGHQIVGAFWLDVQPTYYWMRSLFVEPDYRHHGIATHLLQQGLKKARPSFCYCFNSPSLTDFYQSIGFTPTLPGDLPDDLKKRLLRYHETGKNFIAMRFTAS